MSSTPYEYAVISFCGDLTSPTATSVPVAIVGVSTVGKFYFSVVRQKPSSRIALGGDARAEELLDDLPRLLVQQLWAGVREDNPDRFLVWLANRFRNSLHVSSVQAATVHEAANGDLGKMIGEILALYGRVVEQGGRAHEMPHFQIEPLPEAA